MRSSSRGPTSLLIDVRMPVLDGVEATRRVREAVPETAVLVLTMYDDDATRVHRHAGRRPRLPAQGR